MLPEQYPVFGEFFQFMEAVISIVVCNDIIADMVDACISLWRNGKNGSVLQL